MRSSAPARDPRPPRSCIRRKQRSARECCLRCDWAAPRTRRWLPLRPGSSGGEDAVLGIRAGWRLALESLGGPHDRVAARRRGTPSFAGHDAGIPRRSTAAQRGRSLPGRPATVEEIVAVMRAAGDTATRPSPARSLLCCRERGCASMGRSRSARRTLTAAGELVRRGKGGGRRRLSRPRVHL
jgi:hypothetical protein